MSGAATDPADEVALAKRELRAELLEQRRALSSEQIAVARAQVAEHVLARCRRERWATVAAFLPLRTEPLPVELLDRLRRSGVQVIVPVTLADRDLDWMPWPGETSLGLGAIRDADVVLVPALAVAADGTRLGRGGGSYDRALGRARRDAERVAVVYDAEVLTTVPRAPWDRPVTARVTPGRGWVALG